jgi:hypothetical protein
MVTGACGRDRRLRLLRAPWDKDIAWWALLVALVLTWISGLDYARVAPRLWRGGAPA